MDKLKNGYDGARIDERSAAEKEKDYRFEEIVASVNPVNWVEKSRSAWRKFPIFNQDGSGSCVAQTGSKLLGVLYWLENKVYVHFSATHLYQQRFNKPNAGMSGNDALEIMKKGVTLEELVPSQSMSDSEMDAAIIEQYKKDVGGIFKIGNYVNVATGDIDKIASIIQTTKKAMMVWFYFNYNEWTDVPSIKDSTLNLLASNTCRHSVTAVDFTLCGQSNLPDYPETWGKKGIIIEDSWGLQYGLAGQRVITEDFFKARNWFAAYPINFKFNDQTEQEDEETTKPKYKFSDVLKFGQTNDDIKALQDILRYEGVYPANVASTGYYGAITAKGLIAWQRKYKVAAEAELAALAGKICGPKTIAKLNEIYS